MKEGNGGLGKKKKKKNEAMHQAPRTSHKHLACITTVTSTMHPRLTSQPVFPF